MNPIVIRRSVLAEAGAFFESCGVEGHEGTAMIAARLDGDAHRLIVPDQEGGNYPDCYVEVNLAGKMELLAQLGPDERYVARIHSHPATAFHSRTDDENPGLTHEGALSIVVPFFGLGLRRGLDACAVFVLRSGSWEPVLVGPDRDRLVRTE